MLAQVVYTYDSRIGYYTAHISLSHPLASDPSPSCLCYAPGAPGLPDTIRIDFYDPEASTYGHMSRTMLCDLQVSMDHFVEELTTAIQEYRLAANNAHAQLPKAQTFSL